MASIKPDIEPIRREDDSETDRASFTSSDDDVDDHIMLSERKQLMIELNKKRKLAMITLPKKSRPRKALPWLRTQCSTTKIYKLRSILQNRALRDDVERMGFGSLLKVDNIRMPLKFLKQVVTRFDPYKCALYDHTGMKLEFGRIEIGDAIGVPYLGHKIQEHIDDDLNLQLRQEFGLISVRGEEPKVPITTLRKRLSEFTTPSDEFRRWFIAYVLTCFLCPTTADSLSVSNIPAILVAANAEKYNWAEYVLRWLRRFSKSFHGLVEKKKEIPNGHGGCLAALLFIYLDSADDAHERGLPKISEEDLGTMCCWKKEQVAARLKEEFPLISKAKKIKMCKDSDNEEDTFDKISVKEYVKESPGMRQKVKTYKRETCRKKMRQIISKAKLQETEDGCKVVGDLGKTESSNLRKPTGVVIWEGKVPKDESTISSSKGKEKAVTLEMENEYLRKRLKKMEKYEQLWQSTSTSKGSGVSGTSTQLGVDSVNGSTMVANNEDIASNTVPIIADVVMEQVNEKIETKSEAGELDMKNPKNWIMVVYGDSVQDTPSEEHPGMTKEDVAAVIEMFKAEHAELSNEKLSKEKANAEDEFMPSFDLGFCTPEMIKKESVSAGEGNEIENGSKSSGTLQHKPPRRRLQPVRFQDHVVDKIAARRPFKDPNKWEEVKKSFIGSSGKSKEDDIIERVWTYMTVYKTTAEKWEPVLEYNYSNVKFDQNMLREELSGLAHLSNSIMDLYALRLMYKWKIRKVNRLHSPIYIMPSAFSVYRKSKEGNIIFKHADRVFVPVLSRTTGIDKDKLGIMKWWCICINFAQIRVDVLNSVATKLDEVTERCVGQIVQCVISTRARINNKEYDYSAFLQTASSGNSDTKWMDNIHSCGLRVLKWFEEWDGLYESSKFGDESADDFKKWMVANMIVDGDNKHLYSVVPKIGFPISNL